MWNHNLCVSIMVRSSKLDYCSTGQSLKSMAASTAQITILLGMNEIYIIKCLTILIKESRCNPSIQRPMKKNTKLCIICVHGI